jgi:hypothetical protein
LKGLVQMAAMAKQSGVRLQPPAAVEHSRPSLPPQGRSHSAAHAALPATATLQRLQELAAESPRVAQLQRLQMLASGATASEENGGSDAKPVTPKATANRTGLPDRLKHGIEALSGLSMDAVRVHYNSAKPAQLNALAYAQGTDIHLGPGQEKHLPHEAWHVVQQAQGRVRPTMQMAGGVPVNDEGGLEREADAMGRQAVLARDAAIRSRGIHPMPTLNKKDNAAPVQRKIDARKKQLIIRHALTLQINPNFVQVVEVPIVEVPNERQITVATKFSDYGDEQTYNLESRLMNKSMKDIGAVNESTEDDYLAQSAIKEAGDAAYIAKEKLIIINEETDNHSKYSKDLLHEMGHFKQQTFHGLTHENTPVLLLEWHNIIAHENLFDPEHPRCTYTQNHTTVWEDRYKEATEKQRSEILKEIGVKIDKELEDLDPRGPDLHIFLKINAKNIYEYLHAYLKAMNASIGSINNNQGNRFEYRRMILNAIRDLKQDLRPYLRRQRKWQSQEPVAHRTPSGSPQTPINPPRFQ